MRTGLFSSTLGQPKGFFSIDFLLAIGVIVTIFASIYSVELRWREVSLREGEMVRAQGACEKLLAAINTVYTNENLEIFVLLPSNFSYTLTLSQSFLYALRIEDNSCLASVPVLCAEVVKPFTLGPENLAHPIRVSWKENEIIVEAIE
jgi:hypothetical protein